MIRVKELVIGLLVGSLLPIAGTSAAPNSYDAAASERMPAYAPDVNCHSNSGSWATVAVWEFTPLPEVQVSGPVGSASDDFEVLVCGRQDGVSRAVRVEKNAQASEYTVYWYSGVSYGSFTGTVIDTTYTK